MIKASDIHIVADGPVDAPLVVLVSGLAGAITDWAAVTRLLAPSARVLRFDRPGNGASTASPEPPSARREVAVLDAVLKAADVGAAVLETTDVGTAVVETADVGATVLDAVLAATGEPAVLVGHSLGGLHVEAYARLRPERVRGAVLVDPSLAPPGIGRPFDLGATCATALVRLGLADVAARAATPLLRLIDRPSARAAVVAELAGYPSLVADVDALRDGHPMPDVPWAVLTAGGTLGGPRTARRVLTAHESMAAFAPRGMHRIVPGSSHLMQLDDPAAVAEAVLRCLALS